MRLIPKILAFSIFISLLLLVNYVALPWNPVALQKKADTLQVSGSRPYGTAAAMNERSNLQPAYRPELFPENTAIPFGKSSSSEQALESGSPPAGAKLYKSFALPDSEAEVLVYANEDPSAGLPVYLKGKHSQWKLDSFSGFDENEVWIKPLSFVSGEKSGAAVEIPFGPTAKTGLLIYDHNTDSWDIIDFQGHNAAPIDLDSDGTPEWIGNQTDWVPPALEIHRWAAEHGRFESAVLQWHTLFPGTDDETPSHSSLFIENGKHLIQIGNHDAYAFFTFDQGVLKKYLPEDTRDRVLEMQTAKHRPK